MTPSIYSGKLCPPTLKNSSPVLPSLWELQRLLLPSLTGMEGTFGVWYKPPATFFHLKPVLPFLLLSRQHCLLNSDSLPTSLLRQNYLISSLFSGLFFLSFWSPGRPQPNHIYYLMECKLTVSSKSEQCDGVVTRANVLIVIKAPVLESKSQTETPALLFTFCVNSARLLTLCIQGVYF